MNTSKYFSPNYNSYAYAIRILIGCGIVWWSLHPFTDVKKVWALISFIVVSDLDFENVRSSTISRVINTVTGCIIGLIFLLLTGVNSWSMMLGITAAVFVSTSFKKYPASWKLAPVTVIIVMMPSIAEHVLWKEAMLLAVWRTIEVLYGSFVAFVLGWLAHLILKNKKVPEVKEEVNPIAPVPPAKEHE